jgi:periplasmic glucans biosynthesis protein
LRARALRSPPRHSSFPYGSRRPLDNPVRTVASAFADNGLRGFGLLQRDRVFDHYLDGVRYDLRPSLWVEPLEARGEGAVQLVEIPTDDEIHDNIVAMWVPKQPARAGERHDLRYRLHWSANEPHPTPLARCVATRLGRGGQPGKPRPKGVRKFVVEFLGGPLIGLPRGHAAVSEERHSDPVRDLALSLSPLLRGNFPRGEQNHVRQRLDG